MRFVFLFFLFLAPLFADDAYNGKSIVLTLPTPAGTLCVNDANYSVLAHPLERTKGIVIVPIDYYTQSGDLNATWIAPGKEQPVSITVKAAQYPTEELSVDPSLVTPPPEAIERIERERAQAHAIYAHFSPVRYWDNPFILPIESVTTSAYGSARTYNGTLKSYHGGIDFRALTPTPIIASNDGIVVLAEERYYSGGTIIIDHGEGVYSCYFHLSRFDVAVGDYVKRGQEIALTGASGRITGPHLHFGFMVHGVQTDPLELIRQINALFGLFQDTQGPFAGNTKPSQAAL